MRKRMMEKLRKISKMYYVKQILACLLVYYMLFGIPVQVAQAFDPPATEGALPSGGTVPTGYGSASFNYDYPNNNLAIENLAAQTVINWDNFDIGKLSTVNFNDEASFAVLNRVIGDTGPTGIYGNLFANGTIFVINTRGIVFGPESFIQARNFVASGIDIQNSDFMDGDGIYQFGSFTATEGHPFSDVIGNVTNEGIDPVKGINAVNVALIGQNVTNKGVIRTAPGGAVIMAAGERVLLNEVGSNVVVEVDMTGPAIPTVDNTGTIEASSGNVGKVVLAAGDIFSTAISGVGSLAATAHGDIELNGDFEAGNMTITADYDGVEGGSVSTTGRLTSTVGNIEISASDNTIFLGDDLADDVIAAEDIILHNNTVATDGVKLDAGGDIHLDDHKTLEGEGDLALEANNDIYLGGDTTAGTAGSGKLSLTSDADDADGGVIEAKGNIVAAGELSISGNVLLTGEDGANTHSNQTIQAQNAGRIIVNQSVGPTGVGLTEPYVNKTSDGDLKMLAGSDISLYGHVTVDAGKLDIAAGSTAGLYGNLKSSDDMTLASNTGGPGFPDYLRLHGNAESTDGTVSLKANGSNIYLYKHSWNASEPWQGLKAGEDILINDNTDVYYVDVKLDAGRDVVLADGKSLTGDGTLTVEADHNISLLGPVEAEGTGDVILTTISGDVIVDDVKALDNQITIDSAGAILEDGSDGDADLTADILMLTANDGIGRATIETAANIITARTIDENKPYANIWLSNNNDSPTWLEASADGQGSSILFEQWGGGKLTLMDVSTVNAGIYIDAYSGDIVATQVNAGGLWGKVYLETYDSGDITVGSVTATYTVDMISAGSINDATDDKTVDITASDLGLTARAEIGGSPTAGKTFDTLGAIETDVETLNANSWGLGGDAGGGGDIVIVEKDNVELLDVVAESGSIFLEATNGGMTHIGEGVIKAGSSTLTLVQQEDLDLAGFYFDNQENTDLMVKVTNGEFIADDLVPENAADQWQSIQAIATDNIVLQGSDNEKDIKIGLHEGFEKDYLEFGGVVTSTEGGVSIISDKNTVRTAGLTMPILDNVTISGTSNDDLDIGVDLPYGIDTGKAAIVIMSAEDLMLGPGTILTASGTYDTTGAVDDREGVDFLDVPASIPSGFPRYEGDPFDVAIYLQSKDGDVDVSSTVSIMSYNLDGLRNGINGYEEPYEPEIVPQGAMVIDAWDTVTFDGGVPGGLFETSLAGNGVFSDVGDRLEVVSRITEWLFQAAGRLPYPSYPYYGGGPFPSDYTYVLRGAGLDNPAIAAITDDRSRAWVLVDPTNAPLDREAGENAEKQALGLDGCPVLLAAASAELGIPGETIEVSLANAYALNTDIQPCESCARLVNAAAILRDEDGSRMAALNQVFNTVAPADAPFTPEVAASIVTAFAGRVNDGTQYATAIEYIDAFVRYIAVLSTEMGSPVGDSLAFVMDKYGAGVLGSDNSNIAAFVATRLESGETFGD